MSDDVPVPVEASTFRAAPDYAPPPLLIAEVMAMFRPDDARPKAPNEDAERTRRLRTSWKTRPRGTPTSDLPPEWPDPVAVLQSQPAATERLSTGIGPIDSRTQGGIAPGRLMVIVGPPESGKTMLAKMIVENFRRKHGAVAVVIAADEGAEPFSVMVGQGAGFDRTKLESADPEALRSLGAILGGAIRVLDPDDPETTLFAVAERLRTWRETWTNVPLAILLDSAQTVKLGDENNDNDDNPRDRVTALMEAARRVARELAAVVIVVSQSNRAAYRSKKRFENITEIAGGAESRAVEFCSDLYVWMVAEQDDHGRQRLTVKLLKNRLAPPPGNKGTFHMSPDSAHAQLLVIDEAEAALEPEGSEEKAVQDAVNRILMVLGENKGEEVNGLQLYELCGGNKATHLKARKAAKESKPPKIKGKPAGSKGVLWSLV